MDWAGLASSGTIHGWLGSGMAAWGQVGKLVDDICAIQSLIREMEVSKAWGFGILDAAIRLTGSRGECGIVNIDWYQASPPPNL